MTQSEFHTIAGFISHALQRPMTEESESAYFVMLGDLPTDVMQAAAQRVVLTHKWASFPSIAELREAAAAIVVPVMDPQAAWAIAWKSAGKIDPEQIGSAERVLQNVPPIVREAMLAFGVDSLCRSRDPVTVIRAQFVKHFDAVASRVRSQALLPAALQRTMKALTRRHENAGLIEYEPPRRLESDKHPAAGLLGKIGGDK